MKRRHVLRQVCAMLEAQGINLSDFDMMIAAHAVAVDATLVSRDKAFAQVSTAILPFIAA